MIKYHFTCSWKTVLICKSMVSSSNSHDTLVKLLSPICHGKRQGHLLFTWIVSALVIFLLFFHPLSWQPKNNYYSHEINLFICLRLILKNSRYVCIKKNNSEVFGKFSEFFFSSLTLTPSDNSSNCSCLWACSSLVEPTICLS